MKLDLAWLRGDSYLEFFPTLQSESSSFLEIPMQHISVCNEESQNKKLNKWIYETCYASLLYFKNDLTELTLVELEAMILHCKEKESRY